MKKSEINQQPDAFEAEETLLSKIEAQLQDEEAADRSNNQRLERRELQKSDSQSSLENDSEQSDLSAKIAGLKGQFFGRNVKRESLFEDGVPFSIEQDSLEELLTEFRGSEPSKEEQKKPPNSTNPTSEELHDHVSRQLEELSAKQKEIEDLEDELNRDVNKLSQERDSFEKKRSDSLLETIPLGMDQAQVEEVREAFAEDASLSSDSDQESIEVEDLRSELAEIFGIPVSSLKQRQQEMEALVNEDLETVIEEEIEPEVENEPEMISSPAKRRIREESAVMQSSLDSFRELANLSARSAVAKSNLVRERVILKVLSIFSVLGWLITLGLLSVELWSTTHCRFIATVFGSCSLLLSARVLLSCIAIKKFEAGSQIAPDSSQTELSAEK